MYHKLLLRYFLLVCSAFILLGTSYAQPTITEGSTLRAIRERDKVRCGIHLTSKPGFTAKVRGDVVGFEADFCRVIAAATLGDPRKVEFLPFSSDGRFFSLELNEMDVLIRSTTWTSERDSRFVFGPIIFYDEQAFLVRDASPIQGIEDFNNQTICVNRGTTSQQSLALIEQIPSISIEIRALSNYEEAQKQYLAGNCQIWTADKSSLLARRSLLPMPEEHRFLDLNVVLSKEPLAPVVQQGDSEWADIVRWSVYATILAEELGVNSSNVRVKRDTSRNASIQRLLGVTDALPESLGLSEDAFYTVIQRVGNYGEIFSRNLDGLGIIRGQNALYTRGGLMYAPPIR